MSNSPLRKYPRMEAPSHERQQDLTPKQLDMVNTKVAEVTSKHRGKARGTESYNEYSPEERASIGKYTQLKIVQ